MGKLRSGAFRADSLTVWFGGLAQPFHSEVLLRLPHPFARLWRRVGFTAENDEMETTLVLAALPSGWHSIGDCIPHPVAPKPGATRVGQPRTGKGDQ
jgi:hypothetical protein